MERWRPRRPGASGGWRVASALASGVRPQERGELKNEEDMGSAPKIRTPQSAFRHRRSDLVISIL